MTQASLASRHTSCWINRGFTSVSFPPCPTPTTRPCFNVRRFTRRLERLGPAPKRGTGSRRGGQQKETGAAPKAPAVLRPVLTQALVYSSSRVTRSLAVPQPRRRRERRGSEARGAGGRKKQRRQRGRAGVTCQEEKKEKTR